MAQPYVPVDLGEMAREVVSDLEVRLAQTGGRVDVGMLPTVEADPLQMRQLFQNLIGNALKFRRAGNSAAARINVGASTAPAPGAGAEGASTPG